MGLFSTTHRYHQVAPAYPQEVTIHNAPASDQARLLHDLEREAQERILFRAAVENELIKANVLVERDLLSFGYQARIVFTLNRKLVKATVSFSEKDLTHDGFSKEGWQDVADKVARLIAVEIAEQLLPSTLQATYFKK